MHPVDNYLLTCVRSGCQTVAEIARCLKTSRPIARTLCDAHPKLVRVPNSVSMIWNNTVIKVDTYKPTGR
jgi:hypothetical protein